MQVRQKLLRPSVIWNRGQLPDLLALPMQRVSSRLPERLRYAATYTAHRGARIPGSEEPICEERRSIFARQVAQQVGDVDALRGAETVTIRFLWNCAQSTDVKCFAKANAAFNPTHSTKGCQRR
ncbi:MAG: hypothetical protein M3Q30_23205, partial [Actinomycetota bacterium]|nr:hypothetical protein [Actinomycetota bacterium]